MQVLRILSSLLVATAALAGASASATNATESASLLATTAYRYRTYGQITDALFSLQSKYPTFVEVYSAQSKYGIPLRNELMCVRGGVSAPCQHYVIEITDELTLPDAQRPEVFISGALHGNERVGPQTAIALAEFLLDHAGREDGNPWVKRLVQTRRVVIMPTTNAHGYEKNVREENGYDPNRDFNYNKGSTCFQTIVARAVNEVWRDHLFQLSITFHGGTRSISYEWGSTNHMTSSRTSHVSPDDKGQWYVAKGMSRYGGKFQEDSIYYPDGRMNDIVYAVDGGMEDWAYAASWENAYTSPKPIGVCNPSTYGGYSATKSSYNSATHRAFNILIETSTAKQPTEASLGNNATLTDALLADYLPSTMTVGHVARNLRVALMYIDLVQPYVAWKDAPTTAAAGVETSIQWEVAGSITVDNTQLKVSTSPDMSSATLTTAQSGVTRWYHPDFKTSTKSNKGLFTQRYLFPSAGTYYVQAVATVDKDWASQGTGASAPLPNVKPQTHVVNARTNTAWSYSNNGHTVTGKTEWTSPVIKVVVG